MKECRNRIFISDLPETATEEAIRNAFSDYGKVVSVEIKKRKELGTKNSSLYFAYINIDTDHKTLQQCFKDFSAEKWLGQYVYLQLARESFLDRLKREREENPITKPSESVPEVINNGKHNFVPKFMEVDGENAKKKLKSNSFSKLKTTVQDEKPIAIIKNNQVIESEKIKIEEEESDIVIKNNRCQTYGTSGLKIASVGKEPIVQITKTNKVEMNNSKANIRRLESLKKLKKDYQNQKSVVQAALSKIDVEPKNKIIFDDIEQPNSQQQSSSKDTKKVLFDNEESDEDFEGNFDVKEQFQGAEGQKLLALQSKYKNDRRFTLDARFLENNNENIINNSHTLPEDDEDITLEEEKKREFEILNKILGKEITNLDKKPESQKKVMLRFDPSQAEHSKFEVKKVVVKDKKKKKRDDNMNEKKQEEKEIPEVSQEIFYKVADDLKDSLQEKKEFSLLSLFGKSSEQVADDEEKPLKTVPQNNLVNEKNPFRYDSSDDDNETEETMKPKNVEEHNLQPQTEIKQRNFWVESFFFKPDDYRLQEGFDFIEKIKSEDRLEFTKLRRELKEVVKAKVRNNQRKNKPFKKKLGGNKRKKMIRMKKAMKR